MDFHDFFVFHVHQKDPVRRKGEAVLKQLTARWREGGIGGMDACLDLDNEPLAFTLDKQISAKLYSLFLPIDLNPPHTTHLSIEHRVAFLLEQSLSSFLPCARTACPVYSSPSPTARPVSKT